MKMNRRMLVYVIYILLGGVLVGLGCAEMVDEFWSGMGGALVAVGVLRLVRVYRLNKDESYREWMEVESADERNRLIRNKAWAWAGYLFVLIIGVCSVAFRIAGQELLSVAAGFAVCLMVVLFWISYVILRKKY